MSAGLNGDTELEEQQVNGRWPDVFFRHVPKTAGTSLMASLSAALGEVHAIRLHDVGTDTQELARRRIAINPAPVYIMSGHINCNKIPSTFSSTRLTLLRDPIDRVLSLYHFLLMQPAEEKRRLGLDAIFTIEQLVQHENPELHGQVHNGMVRFFSHSPQLGEPAHPSFWQPEAVKAGLDDATASLADHVFGLVDGLDRFHSAVERVLHIPYRLEIAHENKTGSAKEKHSTQDLLLIAEANTADCVLFHRAREMVDYQTPLRGSVLHRGYDRRFLFDPVPGRSYTTSQIAGRQGFDVADAGDQLGWIGSGLNGRINLDCSATGLKLTLFLFTMVPNYPVAEIRFLVDGAPWRHTLSAAAEGPGHWICELAPLPPHEGIAEISICPPFAMPVRAFSPESGDRRSLSVALAGAKCALA